MLGTAGGVLLIGLVRWYFGMSHRATAAPKTADDAKTADAQSAVGGIVAKLHSLLRPDPRGRRGGPRRGATQPRGRLLIARPPDGAQRAVRHPLGPIPLPAFPRTVTTPRVNRASGARTAEARRPPATTTPPNRPAGRGAAQAGGRSGPARPISPGRSSRAAHTPQPLRTALRAPSEQRRSRSSRFDGGDRYGDSYDPPGAPEHFGRYDSYERYEPAYEPRRRRPAPNGNNPTHHPISQVRYRGAGTRRRARGRAPGAPEPITDAWPTSATPRRNPGNTTSECPDVSTEVTGSPGAARTPGSPAPS